jgi:hypothetical protein
MFRIKKIYLKLVNGDIIGWGNNESGQLSIEGGMKKLYRP